MSRLLAVALGVLTAIGGFVDIGDLVTNAVVGSRFGLSLAWVVVLGVGGIIVYAQMAGKVAAVSGRSTFEIIRERLGPRAALANLFASFVLTALTLTAEIGGMAIALQLLTGVVPLAWIVAAALGVWLVVWCVKFTVMENVAGLLGLLLLTFLVAFAVLGPDWSDLGRQALQRASHPAETPWTYAFYVVALFGAAMTPYEVFFFSSGAIEERWDKSDLATSRLNVGLGFPLGGVLSLAIAGCAAVYLMPHGIEVNALSDIVLPVGAALGAVAVVVVLIGILAATTGAALETALSCGYMLAQYRGWAWGKRHRPAAAPQFHLVIIGCVLAACAVLATGVDPVLVTEFSVVFSAVALPLTYFPILVVANDTQYVGDDANGPVMNAVAQVYLVLILVAAVAAVPLLVATRMGA